MGDGSVLFISWHMYSTWVVIHSERVSPDASYSVWQVSRSQSSNEDFLGFPDYEKYIPSWSVQGQLSGLKEIFSIFQYFFSK